MAATRGRVIILPRLKYAFFTAPKCASRSETNYWLERVDGWQKLPVNMGDAAFKWDGWEEYERHAIVRNPIDRFLSGYHYGRARGLCPESIDEAVEMVVSRIDALLDQHFRSMRSFWTCEGDLMPNVWMRFEDLPEAWPLEGDFPHINATKRDATLTADHVAALKRRFADDFELWESLT